MLKCHTDNNQNYYYVIQCINIMGEQTSQIGKGVSLVAVFPLTVYVGCNPVFYAFTGQNWAYKGSLLHESIKKIKKLKGGI